MVKADTSLEDINGYAGIERYLCSNGVHEVAARSFVRLAKESLYNDRAGAFRFIPSFPKVTKQRLSTLKDTVGVLFFISKSGENLYWLPAGTERIGSSLMGRLISLAYKTGRIDDRSDYP